MKIDYKRFFLPGLLLLTVNKVLKLQGFLDSVYNSSSPIHIHQGTAFFYILNLELSKDFSLNILCFFCQHETWNLKNVLRFLSFGTGIWDFISWTQMIKKDTLILIKKTTRKGDKCYTRS